MLLNRQMLKDTIEPPYVAWSIAADSYHSFHMPDDTITNVFEEDLCEATGTLVDTLKEISSEFIMPNQFNAANPYLSSVADELKRLRPFVRGELKQQLSDLASLIAQAYSSRVPPAKKLSKDEPELHPSLGGSYHNTLVQ